MEKKKVLIVSCIGLGNGGVQNVVMQIVRNLKEYCSFDAVVFVPKQGFHEAEFSSYGGRIFRLAQAQKKNRFAKKLEFYTQGFDIYQGVKRILVEYGPYDVIHCHNYFESAACVKAAKEVGVPVRIIHAHGFAGHMDSFARKLYVKICRSLMKKHATSFVGCSTDANAYLFGKGAEATVVHNSVDLCKFDRNKYEQECAAFPCIVQVGQFCDNKNQDFAVQVFVDLICNEPDARLSFVGFGKGEQALHQQIEQLGLSDKVSFYPGDTDIPKVLAGSNIMLFPSKAEGFGIVLLEAQAMGLRCYASDTVPRDADVGGCTFLPLSDGPKIWAERILTDFERDSGVKKQYDCSAFSNEKIMEKYHKLYSGGQL